MVEEGGRVMAGDMEQQVDAIFAHKVYCRDCFYYVPPMVTARTFLDARCRHGNARYIQDTFEGPYLVSIPPERRNAQNDCEDWTRYTFFSDLGHNPFKLLLVVLAGIFLTVTLVKVLFP